MDIIERILRRICNKAYIKFIKSKKTEWAFYNICQQRKIIVQGKAVCFFSIFYRSYYTKENFYIFQKEDGRYVIIGVDDRGRYRSVDTNDDINYLFYDYYIEENDSVINPLIKKGIIKNKKDEKVTYI